VNFYTAIVADEAQVSEFVHEITHSRARRADHLCQRFLTKFSHDWLGPTFLAEIRKEKEKSGKALFARIK